MNLIRILILVSVFFIFNCKSYYFPAFVGRRSLPIQTSTASLKKHNHFLSFSIHKGAIYEISNNHNGEYNLSGDVNYSISYFNKLLGFEVANSFYLGDYYVNKIKGDTSAYFKGWYLFAGLNQNIFGGIKINLKRNIILFGPQFGYFYEFGDYSSFRKKAEKAGYISRELSDIYLTLHGLVNWEILINEKHSTLCQIKGGFPEQFTFLFGYKNIRNTYWISFLPIYDQEGCSLSFGYSRKLR